MVTLSSFSVAVGLIYVIVFKLALQIAEAQLPSQP